jgi:hypothetical protein
MYCPKCGNQNQEGVKFCKSCGAEIQTPRRKPTGVPSSVSPKSGGASCSPTAPKKSNAKSVEKDAATGRDFLDRYDDGRMTLFICVAGIITSIIAFCTFSKIWVVFHNPFFGEARLTLLGFSSTTKELASVTQYFSADATGTYTILSLIATASHWLLLFGAIASIIASLAALISPKAEVPGNIVNYICVTAFAVIGLVFTAVPIVWSQYFSFTPIPLIMLIFAGIPAVVMRFLG